MRVSCEVEFGETETETESGREVSVACTHATCGRCGHETMSYGDGEASVKRCLVLMREECPRGENHFYVEGRTDDNQLP